MFRRGHKLGPLISGRDAHTTNVLIEVKDQLEGVSGSEIREGSGGALQADTGLNLAAGAGLGGRPGHREPLHKQLVRGEGEAELRGGTDDTRGTALEEGLEALLLQDGRRAVTQARVADFALAGFHLQAGLDDIAGRREVGGGHTGDSTCRQELHHAQLLGLRLAEEIRFQMRVGGEVDGGEGNYKPKVRTAH